MRDNRPSNITLESPSFPYLITDESPQEIPQSYLSIQLADQWANDRDLFYVVGAQMSTSSERDATATVTLRHSIAKDDSADRCILFSINVNDLQIKSMYNNTINFTGWMTKVHFYPSDYTDDYQGNFDPFADFVADGTDRWDNINYPYLPPIVDLGLGPVRIEISFRHGFTEADNLLDTLRKSVEAVHEEKRAAKAREEAFLREQEEKNQQRMAERREWLKTPEGQKEVAVSKFIKNMKRMGGLVETLSDEQKAEIEQSARDYLDSLTVEYKEAVKDALADRGWFVPPKKVGMLAYLDAAEKHLGL